MSTIVLGNIGTVAGGVVGGPLGAAIGSVLGSTVGSAIDNKIFGLNNSNKVSGARLSDLSIQSSAYSKMIPIIYGKSRVAGNIIWSLPIKESIKTDPASDLGKMNFLDTSSQNLSYYSYTVTLAIAISEGKINELLRVWADSKVLNFNDFIFRFYDGSENQMPDPLIESIEGLGETPAYRGLSYIVIEDFPLLPYGNRIPNFTFEVRRKVEDPNSGINLLEDMITGVNIIPGAGEFVYDTVPQSKVYGANVNNKWIQRGNKNYININNFYGKADSLVALDQMQSMLKNLEWVSVVVAWFVDGLDAKTIVVKPGVEYKDNTTTFPNKWAVSNFDRFSAKQITLDKNNIPLYGGTPSDGSLINYLKEIKSRGIKISFNPVIFVDIVGKPWRGHITSKANYVSNFFNKEDGYNQFVEHYADLLKDYVDVFIIGSELKGLTSVMDFNNKFPAVSSLVDLAARVRNILLPNTKITYAADWSEYHHAEGGWYNLDDLWASDNIDMVGIDAYFPLKDEAGMDYNIEKIISGWESGEGYDWIYTNTKRDSKEAIEERFAWKNIRYWWENNHINPDNQNTSWVPMSKKIWFLEYGFPSVDGAANQPNVFFDNTTIESHFPRFSKGLVDFEAQRTALFATEKYWENSDMVEQKFIWSWDARPFPFWPDLKNVWADSEAWKTGHWVQGKLGKASIASVIKELNKKVNLDDLEIDVSLLTNLLEGYVINRQISVRNAIDELRSAFFFDAVESGKKIKYVPRGINFKTDILEEDLLPITNKNTSTTFETIIQQEIEMPKKVDVAYISHTSNYEVGNQHTQRQVTSAVGVETISLPIVITDYQAKNISDIFLFKTWLERTEFNFFLPLKYFYLEPTDVVSLTLQNNQYLMRITSIQYSAGMLKISAVEEDISVYNFDSVPSDISKYIDIEILGETYFEILDLPLLLFDDPSKNYISIAVSGLEKGWHGCALLVSNYYDKDYGIYKNISANSIVGSALNILGEGPSAVFDYYNSLTVTLLGENILESFTEIEILNGANTALVGDEIIQFKNAKLIEPNKYLLTGLLRGRMGTESFIKEHSLGERFIILNNNLSKQDVTLDLLGLEKYYKVVTTGASIDSEKVKEFTYNARSLKPYSPVHIKAIYTKNSNILISWVRRARINAHWLDNFDVPLGEASEKYEIDLIKDNQVIRTLYSNENSVIYTKKDQKSDFGSVQSSIIVKIYQISEIVGRGSSCYQNIDVQRQ